MMISKVLSLISLLLKSLMDGFHFLLLFYTFCLFELTLFDTFCLFELTLFETFCLFELTRFICLRVSLLLRWPEQLLEFVMGG